VLIKLYLFKLIWIRKILNLLYVIKRNINTSSLNLLAVTSQTNNNQEGLGMSEITKYHRSRTTIVEMIVHLWRQSLLAFSKGNKLRVDEINSSIEKLKQSVIEIDNRLENLQDQR